MAVRFLRVTYFLVVACLSLCVGCSDGEMLKQLDSAAQIVQQSPERALAIVEKIDPAKLRTEEDRARYALVVSEAYYYNYVDVDSDSLTMPMMRYYLDSDNHAERSRAMYQHARVAYNRGELAEAMVSLMEAEESLESVENGKLYGSVQRLKGDIYSEGCLYANALEAYTAARDLYAELGYKEHVEYQNYDIGGTLIQLHRFEDAKVVLEDVLDYAIEVNDARFICALAHELLDLSIYLDDYDMCRKYVSMFETEGVLLYGEPHFICAKAMLMAHDGELEEALALVDHAETLEEDVEWADIDYARYIIYRNCGRHDRALYWQEQSKMSQDELMLEVLEQPVLNVQVEMLKSNLAAEMRERELMLERNVTIYVASGIGFVAVVVALLLYLRYRMRRKDSEIASHIETIESLRVDLERVPHDMALSISSLYRDRFSELNELCDIYYDHSGSSRHKNMVFNKVTDTIAVIKGDAARIDRLEETVDSYRDNAMQRLKETLPRLSDRDYRVALYSFAGFSNRAIALFIDSDPVAVSKIKYNIKQKIKSVGGQDCEYLVGLLTDK